MYVPDTLQRMDEAAIMQHLDELIDDDGDKVSCDFCSEDAIVGYPVYNPRDEVEGRSGVYSTLHMCQGCMDNGYQYESHFYCEGCDKWYIINHSWDVVGVMTDSGWMCQACYIREWEGVHLSECLRDLHNRRTGNWKRINAVPEKELLWEGEFSEYSDFPGYTSLKHVASDVSKAAKEAGLTLDDMVFPVVTHGYQFSVALAVYY